MSSAIGYAGKILNVDLSTGKIVSQSLDMALARKFIGGMGLAAKMLFDEVGPEKDSLSSDNITIFSVGPLGGMEVPQSGRTEVTTKSTLTGTFGSGNAGGYWGPALKSAGYDAVVIRGRSTKPVYLRIDDSSAELLDASFLWGKDTYETALLVRENLGEPNNYRIRIACIGPAGENMVRFAAVVFDCFHSAARCGAGAVMGLKKLKAIAVRFAERPSATEELCESAKESFAKLMEAKERTVSRHGSPKFPFARYEEDGCFPYRNYQSGSLSHLRTKDVERIDEYIVTAPVEVVGCYMCPWQCKHMIEIRSGKYTGLKMSSGTFVNTIYTWTKLGVENIVAAWKFKDVCQRLGIDQGSAAGSIAFAMELWQRGLLGTSDVGLSLAWGDEDAVLEMLRRIAQRKGFGDILAEGSARASVIIGKGSERYVMAVKGMEMLGIDPRSGARLWCFGYVTGPRGDYVKSTHVRADWPPPLAELKQRYGDIGEYSRRFVAELDIPKDLKTAMYGDPPLVDKRTYRGKPLMTKWFEDLSSVINSLSTCLFGMLELGPTYYSRMVSACTGWAISPQNLMMAGERIFNLTKLYGVRERLGRTDDYLPKRFYEEPLPEGPSKGAVIPMQKFNQALDEYYELRGWDKKTGAPTVEKLLELGLAEEGALAGIAAR